MDLDLRLVRYFVAVADELHFGRAAARLHISQPALSKQVRKLEDDLGAPLLVRDSRHVSLTPYGRQFLEDGRRLLAIAGRMTHPASTHAVQIAHIFELDTSSSVAEAFSHEHPDVQVIERSMDSIRQLEAMLSGRLDVAILRVTRQMLADHPTGWHHRLLRLEPMMLVGRPGDQPRDVASLHERPIEVFADAVGSGMYNAHGQYLSAFEREAGVPLRWLGNPGTFANCLAAVRRRPRESSSTAFVLEFDCYAQRYAEIGIPIHRPAELQPVYPWSIAWRDEPPAQPTADFVRSALKLSRTSSWTAPPAAHAPIWLPAGDPGWPDD